MSIVLMIIDDDEDDRDLFNEAVKKLDPKITCITCSGGEEAIKLLQEKKNLKPNAIFLDLNMPRLNGKQCLTKFRNLPQLDSVPIIVYSTSKMDNDVKEVKSLGAAAFLTKPSRQQDLIQSIQFALSQDWDSIDAPRKESYHI